MKPSLARPLATASLVLLTGLAPKPARAVEMILLTKVNGVACTQLSQVACWADAVTGAPTGRLPGLNDWATLGGDNASQAAGQSNQFLLTRVIWLPSFIGKASFPSHFTQYGTLRSSILSVEDGSYTVGAGQGSFGQINVGADSLQGARPDHSLRNPLFEVQGGVVSTGAVKVGLDEFGLDFRSSGEVRLTGGTLQVSGDVSGAGLQPTFVSSKLFIDGGQLNTPRISNFSELWVGSSAGRIGSLRRNAGETASTALLALGVDGGSGEVQLSGVGATLSATQAMIGSGSLGTGRLILTAGGRFETGSLTLAQGAGSSGLLSLDAPATSVAVTGDIDVAAGGQGRVVATGGAHLTSGDVRMGDGAAGSGFIDLSRSDTHWEGRDFSLGAQTLATLRVADGASLSARNLVLGPHATLMLRDGGVQADTLSVAPRGTIDFELTGAAPFYETGFLMVHGALHFEGHLNLSFASGYTPEAGQRLQLFSFDSFSGQLGADQVTVYGFDAHRLDFSQLSVNGSVGVTAAVPEPSSGLMWGAGLAALLGLARRRSRLASQGCDAGTGGGAETA